MKEKIMKVGLSKMRRRLQYQRLIEGSDKESLIYIGKGRQHN
jgi:hypothetical protein